MIKTKQYVKGFNTIANEVTYYSITITENTNRVLITLDTLYAILIINQGEIRPSVSSYQWKINYSESSLMIYANELNKERIFYMKII